MVHELASLVFTIPFNLRNPKEREGVAYPPEDPMVWKYLCNVSKAKSVKHSEARTALFFIHVFSEVAKEIKRVFWASETENKLLPGDLAHRWKKHLSHNMRSFLYEQVIKACEEGEALLDANLDALYHESKHQLGQLLTTLNAACIFPNSNDVRVLLYFDEAHELGPAIPDDKQPTNNKKKTLYDVLCSSLTHFQGSPIFTLFLSTQPSMTLPAPSAETVGLARQQSMKICQTPLTELPFDCHPTFPLRPGTLKLEQLGELPFLARFGRPLFWTLIEASKGTDKSELIIATMELARLKLIYDNNIYGEEFSSLAMLATLDVLITIDYEPRSELARVRELEMVESHMRIIFSVPWHRFYIRSGYPSEPFLAEAASRQMYHYLKSPYRSAMSGILQENFDSGLIDVSQKVELVMRLLLRMAYMNAITVEQAEEIHRTDEPNFSKGCNFLVFLQALFANQFHDVILRSEPDNGVPSTCTLEEAFEHAVVRFTHFVKAVDDSVVSTKSMVSGFLRGVRVHMP
ncbi:hypothetical protein EDC04DRAFT_1332225 [Pisolithus marmoratus]|nr:hypothetical protein EDC04DRAFT_1332225 [Pisolithus marmoratus]